MVHPLSAKYTGQSNKMEDIYISNENWISILKAYKEIILQDKIKRENGKYQMTQMICVLVDLIAGYLTFCSQLTSNYFLL